MTKKMMNGLMLSSMFALPLVAGVEASRAAVLVGFNLSGLSGINSSATPTTVDASVTGLNLTEGAGVTAASGTHRLATHFKDTTTFPNAGLSTFAGAYANGNYFQFGLTVQPGNAISLSAIDEDLRRSSGAAPGNFLYVYSFDGFASPDEQAAPLFAVNPSSANAAVPDLTKPTFTTTGTNTDGDIIPTVGLSAFDNLQNLAAGTTVTFRELAYTSTTTSNSLGIGQRTSVAGSGVNYDLALGGTAVSTTPEPASLALAAAAFACSCRRSRRRA